MSDERTSIVIPVMDGLEVTRTCLEAVCRHTSTPFEVILVDNGSVEDVAGLAREFDAIHGNVTYLRNDENEGFGHASNQGMRAARGEWIVLLNNDVIVTPRWLDLLRGAAERAPDVGLVGPRTNRASGPQRVAHVGYRNLTELDGFAEAYSRRHDGALRFAARIVGLCVLLRRCVVDDVGGFDPCFWLGNFEDDDLCLRAARRGWRAAIADDVFVHHHGSATWRAAAIDYSKLMRENWAWFRHKYDFDQPMDQPYPAARLALARPFDAARDFVPLDPSTAFCGVAPLTLAGARDRRLLCFAEPVDDSWQVVVREYLERFSRDDPTTLVLRIEPPTRDVVENATAVLARILRAVGRRDADLPDLLIDATPVFASRRGSIYNAVDAVVLAGSGRDGLYRREARACGRRVGGLGELVSTLSADVSVP